MAEIIEFPLNKFRSLYNFFLDEAGSNPFLDDAGNRKARAEARRVLLMAIVTATDDAERDRLRQVLEHI